MILKYLDIFVKEKLSILFKDPKIVLTSLNLHHRNKPDNVYILEKIIKHCYFACNWGDYGEALIELREIKSDDLEYLNWIGQEFLFIGQVLEAKKTFEKILMNKSAANDQDFLLLVYSKKAVCNYLLGDIEKARYLFNQVLSKKRSDIDANYGIINYLYQTSQGTKVLEFINAIQLENEATFLLDIWKANHFIYFENNIEKGLSLYERVLNDKKFLSYNNRTSNFSYFYNVNWHVDLAVEKYIELLAKYDIAKLKNTSFQKYILELFGKKMENKIIVSLYFLFSGDSKSAEKILDGLLQKKNYPLDEAEILLYKSQIKYLTLDFDQGLSLINKSLGISPVNIFGKKLYGKIMYSKNEYSQAQHIFDDFRSAYLDNYGEFCENLLDIANSYYQNNEFRDSKEILNQLVSIQPNNENAKKLLFELN